MGWLRCGTWISRWKQAKSTGLVGENGAGKSTLMKIIAGVHHGFAGTMRLDGAEIHLASPHAAIEAGIGMVHQELSAVRELSVAENVYLGAQPITRLGLIDWRAMRRGAREHLASLGIDVDPRARMGALPLGLQQLVEIARVLFSGARIIILDEPTSALSPPEIERLFGVLRRLRAAGRSLIFISHFLEDVLAICDRVTVFRNGRKAADANCAEVDKAWLIQRMIGAGHGELEESYTGERRLEAPAEARVVMSVSGLSLPGAYRDISLDVRAGEVLGLYGFMGSGQLELARTLFGKLLAQSGRVTVDGTRARLSSTARAKRAGIALVPESRRSMLFALEPVFKNMSISILERISRLFLRPAAERAIAREHVQRLSIRPPAARASGRNTVRRQSAESGSGPLAHPFAEGSGAERAHARHGRGRQGRCGEDRPRPARAGRRHCRGLHRAGNRAGACRPHRGDEKGRHRAGIRAGGGQQGPPAGRGVKE